MTHNDINIVYEDNHILVVVKPQNLPVCEDITSDMDLLNLLKLYLKEKYEKAGNVFLALVHRLDRPTGGVMVFGKTSKSAARLCESIKDGSFEKKYLAVTVGVPREKANELTHYLYKDEVNNKVIVVPMATVGGKKAILQYKVINDKQNHSLMDIKLMTGRAHQIRVQMATIGCPLFGDAKYGKAAPKAMSVNLALWAYELRFPHPTTKEIMVFRVYPPTEEKPWRAFDINLALSINIKNSF